MNANWSGIQALSGLDPRSVLKELDAILRLAGKQACFCLFEALIMVSRVYGRAFEASSDDLFFKDSPASKLIL